MFTLRFANCPVIFPKAMLAPILRHTILIAPLNIFKLSDGLFMFIFSLPIIEDSPFFLPKILYTILDIITDTAMV